MYQKLTSPMLYLIIALLVCVYPGLVNAQRQASPTVSALTPEDRSQLEKQRRVVAGIILENIGPVKFQGKKSEIYYLQKIVDKNLILRTNAYDLQALGVVLGDIMVNNLPLRWVVVEDRYGRSRALQFENSDNFFFPVTMISRRVKNNLETDVAALYQKVEKSTKSILYSSNRRS